MTRHAQRLHIGLCQHDLAVLGRLVARIATVPLKWHVLKLRQQLRRIGLMRIVTLDAIGSATRLVIVFLRELGVLHIMTIHAQRGRRLGQMEAILRCRLGSCFMRGVAGIATHVERSMAASLFRRMQTGLMAFQAKIFFLVARRRLQKLVLVIARMRVMARQAVAHRRRMNSPLDIRSFFIGMATDAERSRGRRD